MRRTVYSPNFDECISLRDAGLDYSADSNKTAELVDFAAAEGTRVSRVLRVSLDRHDDLVRHRTEVVPKWLEGPSFRYGKFALIGGLYWYYADIYIPPDWQPDIYPEIILQWHGEGDVGEGSVSPPLALKIGQKKGGENYFLDTRAIGEQMTQYKDGQPVYLIKEDHDLGSVMDDRGKWIKWRFKIRWAFDKTGIIDVYKNNQFILKLRQPNCYNDVLGPWLKAGIYKWDWKNANKADGPVTRRQYFYKNLIIHFKDI